MKLSSNRLGISTQLMLLLAGFTLLITLGLAGLLDNLAARRAHTDIGLQFAEMATQTTDKLDRSLFERYREVRLLAAQAGLAGSSAGFAEKRRFLEEMQQTYPYYAWLGITAPDGEVLVSANRLLEGANVKSRPWFGNALKGVHLTDVHDALLLSKLLQPGGGEPLRFIDIAFPYRDEDGRVAGVLGAHLSLDWAHDIEQSVMLPLLTRKRVEALVLAQDGSVIIGPRPLAGTRLALSKGALAAAGRSGYLVERFADGKTYLVGFSKSQGHSFSPGLNWTVLVRQEIGEAYAPVAQFRREIIVIGLGMALLAAALATLVARRIARPLGALAESARRIESGEARHIGEIDGGYREIGALRHSLHSLIGKLQDNESSMRMADRRKDEFLATLAHELRNPLAPISAAGDLLSLAVADPAQQRRLGAMIARQTRHMTDMIDDLLDVSRVTRGQVHLQLETIGMHEVVAEALEQVGPMIEAKRHRLTTQLTPGAATVMADRTRLVQVVANLLTNAVKYTPEGGRIGLSLDTHDGRVMLAVRDNGIGMSADLMAHAFELFTQETRKVDLSAGGLGVGLALSKQLVALHDGSLSVASSGPGQGSEFTVSLPAVSLPQANFPPVARRTQEVGAAPARVLIVDDNADAADLLGMLVQPMGFEVAVEYGPQAALANARAQPAGICLLDIGMPVMDGYELAARLRELPGMKDALLIAVTGYGDRAHALDAGFDHHLTKPVDTRQLMSLLVAEPA